MYARATGDDNYSGGDKQLSQDDPVRIRKSISTIPDQSREETVAQHRSRFGAHEPSTSAVNIDFDFLYEADISDDGSEEFDWGEPVALEIGNQENRIRKSVSQLGLALFPKE